MFVKRWIKLFLTNCNEKKKSTCHVSTTNKIFDVTKLLRSDSLCNLLMCLDTSFMRIDSSTGVIRLENGTTFTCSSARMYTFRVIATDSAEEGFRRSSETTVTVNVTLGKAI